MEYGQRHMTLVPRLPRARLALAALIFGVAVAGAATLYFHPFNALACDSHGARPFCSRPGIVGVTPGWVLPTALALCLLGVVGAYGVLAARLRIATAAVILGVALGAGAVLYTDNFVAIHWCVARSGLVRNGNVYTLPDCASHTMYWRPSWVAPTTLGILGFGVAAAVVLFASRRGKPLATE